MGAYVAVLEEIAEYAGLFGEDVCWRSFRQAAAGVVNCWNANLPSSLPKAKEGLKVPPEWLEELKKTVTPEFDSDINGSSMVMAVAYAMPISSTHQIHPDGRYAVRAYGKMLYSSGECLVAFDEETLIVEKVLDVKLEELSKVCFDQLLNWYWLYAKGFCSNGSNIKYNSGREVEFKIRFNWREEDGKRVKSLCIADEGVFREIAKFQDDRYGRMAGRLANMWLAGMNGVSKRYSLDCNGECLIEFRVEGGELIDYGEVVSCKMRKMEANWHICD